MLQVDNEGIVVRKENDQTMKPKKKVREIVEITEVFSNAFSKRDISAYSGQAAFFLMLSFFSRGKSEVKIFDLQSANSAIL